MSVFLDFLIELKSKGYLDDFSDEHLLIRALNGKFDFIDNKKELYKDNFFSYESCHKSTTFLSNFALPLKFFASHLKEADFEKFVRDQLSAGKENYDEDQFLRAVSEINVINYFLRFISKNIKVEYEPNLNNDGKNPEIRICTAEGEIFDIEVKTPGFQKQIDMGDKKYLFRPNTILSENHKIKIKSYCDEHNVKFMFPRVLKLKDFIESSASKFTIPTHSKHYNILAINWTYTEFYSLKLREPLNLLLNPINGLLNENESYEAIGIKKSDLEKISGILLYQDNVDTILSQDFIFHLANDSVLFIGNEKFCKSNDYKTLYQLLKIKSSDRNAVWEDWHPSDYAYCTNEDFSVIEKLLDYHPNP